MLSPEYLNLIEFNEVVELYNKLNVEITANIIDRVSAMQEITQTSRNQLKILKQINGTEIFNEALEKTSMLTEETKKSLKQLFEDIAKEDMEGYKELYQYRDKPFQLSESQYKILNQGLKDTNKTLKNFTKTIAFQSQQAYVNTVDNAYMKVVSGAFDYATAIRTACQELANQGITLKDKLGRNVQLEVAVRRNVMTGIQQTANRINRDIEEYLGCDGYEVTAHLGARPTHAEEQGKQFAIKHNTKESKKYPLWSEVEDLWNEYNCRHTYFGIILGVSEPKYSDKELKEFKNATVKLNGKEIPYYEATQKQRQLENAIRKQKRTVQTLERANFDTKIEKSQLAQLQKKYKDFCEETGLEKDYARLQVAKNKVTNSKENVIIDYIRKNNYTKNKNLDTNIKKSLELLSNNNIKILESTKFKSTSKGNSYYDTKNDIIYLLKNSSKYEIIHELAHALEIKMNVYKDQEFIQIINKTLKGYNMLDVIYDPDTFEKPIFRLESEKLVSEYQGRVYQDKEMYLENGTINYKVFKDYFSEGMRIYFENENLLKRKNIDLYNYIRKVLK